MFFRGVKVKATELGFVEVPSKKAVVVHNLPEGVKLVINGTNIKEGKLSEAAKAPTMPEGVSFDPETGILHNFAASKTPTCIGLKLDDQGGILIMLQGVAHFHIQQGDRADFSRYGKYGKDYILEWL